MKIHTLLEYHWEGDQLILDKDEFYEYTGIVEELCGASQQQKDIGASQQSFMTQLQGQASTVFGNASTVFQGLLNTFMPTIKAGPDQQGFSPAELAAMNSQAITNAGTGYKNAKAALGENLAASGGGNTGLPSGLAANEELQLANAGANNTADQLNAITQENYAVGRQNYQNAVTGLAGATGVFNPATGAAGAANTAGEAAANTANQISQEDNSWMSAVSGILGSVAGGVSGGLTNGISNLITKGIGNSNSNNSGQSPYGPNSD